MTAQSLSQWLTYLEQLHPSEIELGLERIRKIAEQMQVLEPAPLVITVAGTNGKGSTCAMLAGLLQSRGLRVGLYSSPHFLRYNERIQIDGNPVADEQICAAFAQIEQARAGTSLTYFEFGTLAALWVFCQAGLDAVILEVGLGGRLDAVNVVEPDIAVITTIALDHADWLGDSTEQVAAEKAGIMRAGKPVVCGQLQPPANLLELARQHGATLYLRGRDFDIYPSLDSWRWQGLAGGQTLGLEGLPQLSLPLENAAVALQVLALLDLPWQPVTIRESLRATRMTGRLQQLDFPYAGKICNLLLDVAHNPQAAEYLAGRLQAQPVAGRRLAVFGALTDKDVQAVVAAMVEHIDFWAVAPLPSSRSCNPQKLDQLLQQAEGQHQVFPDIAQALEHQLAQATPEDQIVVFGSFFTVAQVLEYIASQVEA